LTTGIKETGSKVNVDVLDTDGIFPPASYRWCHPMINEGASVNDIIGKYAVGINNTGGQFAAGIVSAVSIVCTSNFE
jgi:hypothetical protein